MANFPLIAVGTYEEFVLGYKPKIDDAKVGCSFKNCQILIVEILHHVCRLIIIIKIYGVKIFR